MPWQKVSPELSALLALALKSFDCEKKLMFGCPAYFINKNMFSGVFEDSIFIRLSARERDELVIEFKDSTQFEPMKGRVMKEYMVIPKELYNNSETLNHWLERSFQYTSSLPPKKGKRAGKGKKGKK